MCLIYFILFYFLALLEPECSIPRSNRAFIGICVFQAGICPFASKKEMLRSLQCLVNPQSQPQKSEGL